MRVLEFSGGKDSLACLLLLREELDDITVVWANSGDAFPETLALMERVKEMCPHFVEVKGNQPKVVEDFGYPVDVMPLACHPSTQAATGQKRRNLQTFVECCHRSILNPMHAAVRSLGATEIIRGQKLADPLQAPIVDGQVIDGITYRFPIADWSDEDVREFVRGHGFLPEHYSVANTSMDCMTCTAYLAEDQWKMPYLREYYPLVAVEVERRFAVIAEELWADLEPLNKILEGVTNE